MLAPPSYKTDLAALGGQRVRQCPTDAAGGSRDDGDLTRERHVYLRNPVTASPIFLTGAPAQPAPSERESVTFASAWIRRKPDVSPRRGIMDRMTKGRDIRSTRFSVPDCGEDAPMKRIGAGLVAIVSALVSLFTCRSCAGGSARSPAAARNLRRANLLSHQRVSQ